MNDETPLIDWAAEFRLGMERAKAHAVNPQMWTHGQVAANPDPDTGLFEADVTSLGMPAKGCERCEEKT